MELITVNDLSMQFGQHRALDSVDFTVHHGVTGLVGANGAGKTTFMSIALGLRAPTNGSIRVLNLEPVSDGAQLRSLVSYGPERNILPDEMKEFKAREFTFGKTPLVEPPVNCCIDISVSV